MTPAPLPSDEAARHARELEFMLDAVPAMIFYKDFEGRFVRVNREFTRLTGVPPEARIGKSDAEAGIAGGERFRADDLRVMTTGEPIRQQEEQIQTANGPRWLLTDKVPHRDETGCVIGVIGFAVDITERKRADAERDDLRLLIEHSPDFIGTADMEGRVTYLNQGGRKMIGLGADEDVSGLHFTDYVPAEWRAFFCDTVNATVLKEGVWEGEMQLRHLRTGALIDVSRTSFCIRDEAGQPKFFATVTRDITARKTAEEALRASEARLNFALHTTQIGAWELNLLNHTAYRTPIHDRIFGYETLLPVWTYEMFLEHVVAEDREEVDRGFRAATAAQTHWNFECRIRRTDGEVRWIWAAGGHELDAGGRAVRMSGIVQDITERKKLEQQFLRAQRMESIGTLAGGIAHDLNNVLSPILLSLELLKMKFTDPDSQELLSIIGKSASAGADMVRQVLSFARGVEGRRLEIQVQHIIQDLEKLANETFLKHIEVRTIVPHGLWTVMGDPTQLHQVLLNLCVNARDAMPHGGTLTLSAENIALDAQYAGLNAEARPGPYVFLQVEDSGTGMTPEIMEKIFDPFFTTKEVGKGTGLGLSTSLAIIKSHGGFIRTYSEPGKGATFKVYLPAQTEPSPATAVAQEAEMPRGKGELILVVDDEPAVREVTQLTLEAFGYRVLTAADGVEAVAIYARRGAEIALVLTDMMMPVMDGLATIQVLRKMNPAVRIIGASGLMANGHLAKAADLGVRHFLPKPYTAETLLRVLKKVLSAEA